MGKITVICKQCGKEFETQECWVKNGRGLFCSRECSTIGKRYIPPMLGKTHSQKSIELMKRNRKGKATGEKNHNYGKPVSEDRKKKQSEAMKGRYDGENNPMYGIRLTGEQNGFFGKTHTDETKQKISNTKRKEQIERICKICNKRFYVQPSTLKRGWGIYCSHKCMVSDLDYVEKQRILHLKENLSESTISKMSQAKLGKKMSDSFRDKRREIMLGGYWYGNVKYYDYIGPQYCEKWTSELKERVRAFFGYKCVECGEPQNGKKLDVHHVYYNKKACCDNTPRVLVALCHACHSKTTTGDRSYWSNHFQEIIDTEYDGRCWLTKEEYRDLLKHKPLSFPTLMN